MTEKRTVKMYTTGAGAKQYATEKGEQILKKQADILFRSFLRNPGDVTAEKLERLGAAKAAAAAQRWRDSQSSATDLNKQVAKSYDKIEKLELSMAAKRKLLRMLKKANASK